MPQTRQKEKYGIACCGALDEVWECALHPSLSLSLSLFCFSRFAGSAHFARGKCIFCIIPLMPTTLMTVQRFPPQSTLYSHRLQLLKKFNERFRLMTCAPMKIIKDEFVGFTVDVCVISRNLHSEQIRENSEAPAILLSNALSTIAETQFDLIPSLKSKASCNSCKLQARHHLHHRAFHFLYVFYVYCARFGILIAS